MKRPRPKHYRERLFEVGCLGFAVVWTLAVVATFAVGVWYFPTAIAAIFAGLA